MRVRIGRFCTRGRAMRAAVRVGAILVAVAALINIPGGAKAGKTSTFTNVTTIVHDYDASGAQVLNRSDDYNGSGEATYSAKDTNVSSFIDSAGEWFLDLYGQNTRQTVLRQLYVTPNDVYNSRALSVPPAGLYWQNIELSGNCWDQNLNRVPFENVVTSSGNCSLGLDFGYKGTVYKLLMSPVLKNPGDPATGLVTVTCNSVSSNQCVSWTITPNTSAGAPSPTVANLYSYTGGPKLPWVFIGQYYDTFRIHVTNP
jgi:hypothetical protein